MNYILQPPSLTVVSKLFIFKLIENFVLFSRNRFRDGNRRNDRRDDFNRDREDFRDRSPGYYSQ